MRALSAALLVAALGAASDAPSPVPTGAPAALRCPSTATASYAMLSGTLNVFVAGTDRLFCNVRLREHHSANAIVAGSDGTLYVAESALYFVENSTETGAIDVFAPDGRLVRRIVDGVANPVALALDARNRLYVANNGRVFERGVELRRAPHVGVYEPGASSPSAAYPLPAGIGVRYLLLAPNGDLVVGDIDEGVVGRFRPGSATPLRVYRAPHGPLQVRQPNGSTSSYPLDQRALRLRGDQTLVALYGGGGASAFFVEWSLNDGRVLRRVDVARPGDLVVDRENRIIVSQSDGVALVFAPGATNPTARFTTVSGAWGVALDARGKLLFAGPNEIVALDDTGHRVASYRFPHMDLRLVEAPRGRAPPSQETPSPALATPPPPSADDVAANVRGATGVAYDRISAFGLATAPPLGLAWADALRLPGGTLRGKHVPVRLVHVAVLGRYARIANRDESIVEIVDCVHRTVTSLSPARKVARFDVAVPDIAPRPTAASQARMTLAKIYRPSVFVRANGTTPLDGRPAARYDVAVAFGYAPDAPAPFRAENSTKFGAYTSLAFAGATMPVPACADLNAGPRGRIPGIVDAAARPLATRDVELYARVLNVAHDGPPLPERYVLAESGRAAGFGNVYARVGNIRALSQADAALFALPAGVRIDSNAPVLAEPW